MFTIDTESGFRDAVMTSAVYGLGENVGGEAALGELAEGWLVVLEA